MSRPALTTVTHQLLAALSRLPSAAPTRQLYIAYSGGADSTALLLAAHAERAGIAGSLRVFHFDHRLHPASAAWAAHCRAQCAALDLPCDVDVAEASPPAGASIEAWARDQRYAAAARRLATGDLLLTAHHEDDLAETLLLAALRGSGAHGLAGIAPQRALGAGTLLRPLLDLPRATLRALVDEAGVSCLADPANLDLRHDRSFLRSEVLPLLARRWPAAGANLARAARLQQSTVRWLDSEADALLAAAGASASTLPLHGLAALDDARAVVLLRRWLRRASGYAPDAALLARVQRELVSSRHDATPLIAWRGGELRRHRRTLYWLAAPARPLTMSHRWQPHTPLRLPGGELRARAVIGEGLAATLAADGLLVRPRAGGERLKPRGRAHTLPVKQLLQEAGVPPWQRAQLPLIWQADRLVAVADLAVAAECAAAPGAAGLVFDYARD